MKTIQYYQHAYSEGTCVVKQIKQVWEQIQSDEDAGIFITKYALPTHM